MRTPLACRLFGHRLHLWTREYDPEWYCVRRGCGFVIPIEGEGEIAAAFAKGTSS